MNEKSDGKVAEIDTPRIVVSTDDMRYFSVKTISKVRDKRITVSKKGNEPRIIVWPGDQEKSKEEAMIVMSGTDILAALEMNYDKTILAVNGFIEMKEFEKLIDSLKTIGSKKFIIAGRNNAIHKEAIERLICETKKHEIELRPIEYNEHLDGWNDSNSIMDVLKMRVEKRRIKKNQKRDIRFLVISSG